MNITSKFSDITVKLNGKDYKLHKIILDRLHFFSEIFSGKYSEKEDMNFIDISYTGLENKAFEKMIEILYPRKEDELYAYPESFAEFDAATFLGFELDSPEYMYIAHLDSGSNIDLEFLEYSLRKVIKDNNIPKIKIEPKYLEGYDLTDYPTIRLLYHTLRYSRDNLYDLEKDLFSSIVENDELIFNALSKELSKSSVITNKEVMEAFMKFLKLDPDNKLLNTKLKSIKMSNFIEKAKEILKTKY